MRITFVTRTFGNVERNSHCDVLHITPIRVANLVLDCNGDFAIKAYITPQNSSYIFSSLVNFVIRVIMRYNCHFIFVTVHFRSAGRNQWYNNRTPASRFYHLATAMVGTTCPLGSEYTISRHFPHSIYFVCYNLYHNLHHKKTNPTLARLLCFFELLLCKLMIQPQRLTN